jgi:hypothetical protein
MFDYLLLTSQELIANSNVLMAFSFAVSIIALSFMAGEFMSMPSIKAFAKAELYELGVSAVILLFLLLLIIQGGPFDMVASDFVVQGANNARPLVCEEWELLHPLKLDPTTGVWSAENGSIAFGQANFFLGCSPKLYLGWDIFHGEPDVKGVVTPRLFKGYFSLMLTQMFTGLLAGFYTGISIPIYKVITFDVGIMPWIGLGPLNQAHTTIVDTIGTTIAALSAQNMLLKFIERAAIPIFLPFGLMLRAFPFTRKTGSTIIAVVVACYFVYPISILINQQIWLYLVAPPPQAGATCLPISAPCSDDKQCCTYNCRSSHNNPQSYCSSPLTEFSEYQSIYSICNGNPTKEQIQANLDELAQQQDNRMLELYFSGNPAQRVPSQAEKQLQDGLATTLKRHGDSAWQFAKSLLNPLPSHTTQTVFSEIEVLVMDAAQYALLALLFVVISIVVSLTLLKDIAILIGGEPRVFGISKLI